MPESPGLYRLIEQDPAVKQYYDSLPDHIRDQISQQANQIGDEASFLSCVQQLLRTE